MTYCTDKKQSVSEVRERIFELRDTEYRDFQIKLMPTVASERVIGVRVPLLRRLARELRATETAKGFLCELPHRYYEEDCLHAFLIEYETDVRECIRRLDRFLPYVDNWAVCDMMSPRIFKKHTSEILPKIKEWIDSGKTYTVRYGIGMLMRYYLDEGFDIKFPELVASIRSDEYYVNMMIAWYFATALAKRYDAVLPFIEQKRLDTWVHNKTIQKAIESYRISDEHKAYLKTLKIKRIQ